MIAMKNMIITAMGIVAIIASAPVDAKDVKTDDEFIKYNDQGDVILHGKYTRNEAGTVIRYDVYDGDGSLQYYEIPYYRNDGSIVRGDIFSPDGTLIRVTIFFESTAKSFDKDGNHLPEFDTSYSHHDHNE